MRTLPATEKCKFEGRIKRETDKAILFTVYNSKVDTNDITEVWFPLSQVNEIHRTYSIVNKTDDSIIVSQWIAKKNNLI